MNDDPEHSLYERVLTAKQIEELVGDQYIPESDSIDGVQPRMIAVPVEELERMQILIAKAAEQIMMLAAAIGKLSR